MSSIFSMPPLEDGGGVARSGFDYQDHVAVMIIVEMLEEPQMTALFLETHDDILVQWRNARGKLNPEFIQVKSDDDEWTLSRLIYRKPKKDGSTAASLLESQLSRDRGDDDEPKFRVVTLKDINAELQVLTIQPNQRDNEKCRVLANKVLGKIENGSSPGGRDITYWIRQAVWKIAESAVAVEAKNKQAIQKWCYSQGFLFGADQFDQIYKWLLRLAYEKSQADGDPLIKRKLEREPLIAAFISFLESLPPALNRNHISEIEKEERESLSRCEDLWSALGVPRSEAYALARDSNLGEIPEVVLSRKNIRFTWIVADFGSGKTLVLERLFQKHLAELKSGVGKRVPIYLKARKIAHELRHITEEAGKRLGWNRGELLVLIDAIDECGTERASQLLQEARRLSEVLDKCFVVISSTRLFSSAHESDQIELPLLDQTKAMELINKFSRWNDPSFWSFPDEIREASTTPLFAILFGLSLRDTLRKPRSTGELLNSLVTRALRPESNELIRHSINILTQLAVLITDNDGKPVSTCCLGSAFNVQPLQQSRLVIIEDDLISFSISLIRTWFATEALRSAMVLPDHIVDNQELFERWRLPLAIYLSNCDFNQAAKFLAPLTSNHPAWASLVLTDAFRESSFWGDVCNTPLEEFGKQLKASFESWRLGLGKLSNALLPLRQGGRLRGIKAFSNNGKISVVLTDDPAAPEFETGTIPVNDIHQIIQGPSSNHSFEAWFSIGSSQPAWVWQRSQKKLGDKLNQILKDRSLHLTEGPLWYEANWIQVCQKMNADPNRTIQISLIDLEKRIFSRNNDLAHLIVKLKREGKEFITSPYPGEDLTIDTTKPMRNRYSKERMAIRVEAVLKAAIEGYDLLVEEYFPKFRDRLGLCAFNPIKILAHIYEDNESKLMLACYWIFPRMGTSIYDITVSASNTLGTRDFAKLHLNPADIEITSPFYVGKRFSEGGASSFASDHPALDLAYDWLMSDLKTIGFID